MNNESRSSKEIIVDRITAALHQLEGSRLAEIHNDLIEGDITYIGDSLFEEPE